MFEYQGRQYELTRNGEACKACTFSRLPEACQKHGRPACWQTPANPKGGVFIEKKTEQYGTVKLQQPGHYSEVSRRVVPTSPTYKPAHAGYPDVGAVRSSDPDTSAAAAVAVKASSLQSIILLHLSGPLNNEGMTGKELAAISGKPLNSITPRFAQLRAKGLIEAGGMRDKQIVWRLV